MQSELPDHGGKRLGVREHGRSITDRCQRKACNMYDEELAYTGFSIGVGGLMLDALWVMVIGFALILAGLVLMRVVARRTSA